MAVQAQYPSNVLVSNRNMCMKEGEGEEFSRFLDLQPPNHFLCNNFQVEGNTNTRKRGREGGDMNQAMSNFYQPQSHSDQLIDLTKLHSRNGVVSTGLRLAFNDQQNQNKHSLSPQSSIGLTKDLSTQINQQTDEIEHFLQVQEEVLRRTLAEKRQRHYYELLSAAEELVGRKMRDKDLEAEKAVRRNAELEARAVQLSAEAHAWRARAREQEAEAAALQAELQLAMVRGGGSHVEEGYVGVDTEDAESAYVDPERVVVASGPGCKVCGKRVASVVLLPCRHLCVCSECDEVVQACPLCLSFRSSSIEVYMS